MQKDVKEKEKVRYTYNKGSQKRVDTDSQSASPSFSFKYNEQNQRYIGKRTGNRYQKLIEQQHFDGFPRFSDYETLQSENDKLATSQFQEPQYPYNQNIKHQQEEMKYVVKVKKMQEPQKNTNITKRQEFNEIQKKSLVQQNDQSNTTTQFEFKDPFDSKQSPILSAINKKNPFIRISNKPEDAPRLSGKAQNNNNFGEISTIKRRPASFKIRTSQLQSYQQLLNNLQNLDEQEPQQFVFQDDQNWEANAQVHNNKPHKDIKQQINQAKPKRNHRKNTRVSFKERSLEETLKPKNSIQNDDVQNLPVGLEIQPDNKKRKSEQYRPSLQEAFQLSDKKKNRQEKKQKQQSLQVEVDFKQIKQDKKQNKKAKKTKKPIPFSNPSGRRRKNKKQERVESNIRKQQIEQKKYQQSIEYQEESQSNILKKYNEEQYNNSLTQDEKIINKRDKRELDGNKREKMRIVDQQNSAPIKTKRIKQKKHVKEDKKLSTRKRKHQKSEQAKKQSYSRYPQRTRVKPLQYWQNEKIQYKGGKAVGINNVHVNLGKLLNMKDYQQIWQSQLRTKITNIKHQTLEAILTLPIFKQVQCLGFSQPYKRLLLKINKIEKNQQEMLHKEVLVDDGIAIYKLHDSQWQQILPNRRFTIYTQTIDEDSTEKNKNKKSQKRILNKNCSILLKLTKHSEEDFENQ